MDERGDWRGREPVRVERLALEFVVLCQSLSRGSDRRVAAINGQLHPAAASILANVGEALDEPSRGDKRRFFRYALRSAGEAQRLLVGAHRIGAIGDVDLDHALRLLRDLKQDLLRLIRWTHR